MFFKKKRPAPRSYDREALCPVIRASICTGERSAGFQEIKTGRFIEVTLIRTPQDLEDFKAAYGITGEVRTIY